MFFAMSYPPVFQSTPPARGATAERVPRLRCQRYFNPRPPRGGRLDYDLEYALVTLTISIHAPREGGDHIYDQLRYVCMKFQSTPPARGATLTSHIYLFPPSFQSTPPARGATAGESDRVGLPADFNPRPPRGGRRWTVRNGRNGRLFQSTPPARGATSRCCWRPSPRNYFNPRPPRGGRLSPMPDARAAMIYFNPRPPRGGRRPALHPV